MKTSVMFTPTGAEITLQDVATTPDRPMWLREDCKITVKVMQNLTSDLPSIVFKCDSLSKQELMWIESSFLTSGEAAAEVVLNVLNDIQPWVSVRQIQGTIARLVDELIQANV